MRLQLGQIGKSNKNENEKQGEMAELRETLLSDANYLLLSII